MVEQKKQADRVEHPISDYEAMSQSWQMLHDLMGGTRVMREAGRRWLPAEPREKDDQYNARLSRSVLFEAYKSTIHRLAAMPFSRPVTIKGEETLGDVLNEVISNVDGAGSTITQFSKEVFKSASIHGIAHILVDFPNTTKAGVKSLADERQLGARPTFTLVTAPQLIGWKSEVRGGKVVLTQIRIAETRSEADGVYGENCVNYVRVYNEGAWELHKQGTGENKDYAKIEEGQSTLGFVPLVTVYFNRTGFMTAAPPMEGLAWLNICHWQSESDHRNNLRFARVGLLFGKGFSEEAISKGISIGPSTVIWSEKAEADLKYVEHGGKAIEAGMKDLDRLEARMEMLGLKPLVERTADSTATGKMIDENASTTEIQSWVTAVESGMLEAIKIAAKWVQADVPDNTTVNIFNEFGIAAKSGQELELLFKACVAGKITTELFLTELKRRSVLSETINVEAEVESAEAGILNNADSNAE